MLLSLPLLLPAGVQDPGHYAETASRHEIVGERLRRTVAWLANDARAGRRAGTQGELDSVMWIAERLRQYQLAPAGEDGYLQPFEVPLPVRDGGGSWLAGVERVEGRERVAPLACSASGKAEGPLVFRGLGIVHDERGWNDYPGELPSGAVVLLVAGEPEVPVEEQEPADRDATVVRSRGFGAHAGDFHKVMTAARLGASAVLMAPPPEAPDGPPPAFRPGLRASIPALAIRREVAEALLPGFGSAARASAGADVASSSPAASPARARVELFADVERRRGLAYNLLARVEGGDGPTVVVGAHLDHLGRGGPGSLAPELEGEVHNGADDNASGVAALLELAYQLLIGEPLAGDVVLAFWSGEELGLLGSSHWADHSTFDLDEVAAYVNLDMVGRAGDGERGRLQVLGAGSSPAFAGWMEEAGEAAGLDLSVDVGLTGVGGSDHRTFLRRGIPALHLFSGLHGDYHRPSDDLAGFQGEGASRVVDLARDLVRRIQAEGDLPFRELEGTGERTGAGWSVSFGSVPDYTFEGPGLLLSGTTPGSPAAEAGLLAGDVILQVGDVEIADIHSFVYMLQLYKPGDVVLTRFRRDGEEHRVRVTLRSREPR